VLVTKNDIAGEIVGTSCAATGAAARHAATMTGLNARKPVEAEVRVDATRAFAKASHRVHDLNRLDELSCLYPHWRSTRKRSGAPLAGRKVATVQTVGQDRLRMATSNRS
jgi:hypothetical protein